jgi:hypothetical protein
MTVWRLVLCALLGCLSLKGLGQEADAAVAIDVLKKTEILLSELKKQINERQWGYCNKTIHEIESNLEILKQIYSFQYESFGFSQKVIELENELQEQKKRMTEIKKLSIKMSDSPPTVKDSMKLTILILEHRVDLLQEDSLEQELEIQRLKSEQSLWTEERSALMQKLDQHLNSVQLGFSCGFNYFLTDEPRYFVRPDSSIGHVGSSEGVSFIVSGIIGYRITEKHSVFFNIPLGDFSRSDGTGIGVFNRRAAGGLGYGYNIGKISAVFIINISPYKQIEPEVLADLKLEDDTYSGVAIEDFPYQTRYSPSFTVGISYNILRPGTDWNWATFE